MQLDHLGDAVLSTPLIAELRAAYPEATIDVLASPSNHEVFEVDPECESGLRRRANLVRAQARAMGAGHGGLEARAASLRKHRYDLGIDVRGDVLSVLVLALARSSATAGLVDGGRSVPADRRGTAWIPGRHEVRSRLALLERLGINPDERARVDVTVRDEDRITIARRLAEAWPRRDGTAQRRRSCAVARAEPASTHVPARSLAVCRSDLRGAGLAARRSLFLASAAPGGASRSRKCGQALAGTGVEGPGRAVSREWMAGGGRGWDR